MPWSVFSCLSVATVSPGSQFLLIAEAGLRPFQGRLSNSSSMALRFLGMVTANHFPPLAAFPHSTHMKTGWERSTTRAELHPGQSTSQRP